MIIAAVSADWDRFFALPPTEQAWIVQNDPAPELRGLPLDLIDAAEGRVRRGAPTPAILRVSLWTRIKRWWNDLRDPDRPPREAKFLLWMAERFSDRGQMNAGAAGRMAQVTLQVFLDFEGKPYGDPDYDWSKAAAFIIADTEMDYWDA